MTPCPKPVKQTKKRKRLRAVGEKVSAWSKTREELILRFEKAGITQCELRYSGCWVNNALSFAHSKKRRFIISQEELEECCLCCLNCHACIEFRPDMYEIVRRVIASRKVEV